MAYDEARVEVFSKDYCPYCVKAKLLLEQLGAVVMEYDIGRDEAAMADLQARVPSARTVPQIFINMRHVGGCDDLYALHERGGLIPLLAGD